jgi:hypothetical protein
MSDSNPINGESIIELIAGRHPNGEYVVERILVNPQPEERTYQLLKSPVFVRGIARGDIVQQLDKPAGAFTVKKHVGNLCVRVLSKQSLTLLEQALTGEFEKLGGDLDVQEDKILVYSIHVGYGFDAIEKLLNEQLASYPEANWFYGNVYDPESGEPLNWWLPILASD